MRMKLKPKERPKFIGLMTAIALLACYVIFVVIPRLPHTTVAPVTQTTPAPPISMLPVSSSIGAAQNASSMPDANRAALDLIAVETPRDVKRDPFVSPAAPPVSSTSAPTAPAPTPVSANPGAATPPQTQPTPATLKASPTPPGVQPDEKFILIGIAGAEESVAIFQLNHDIVEKKPGDTLPGHMRVEAVEEEAVRLSRGKQQFRMEVGQTPVSVEPTGRGQKSHTPG